MKQVLFFTKSEVEQMQQGNILVDDESEARFIIEDDKVYRVKIVSKTPIYTEVYAPQPQGVGKTTLSKDEYEGLKKAVANNEVYTIYRGEVRDANNLVVNKNDTDPQKQTYYKEHAIKVNLTIENDKIKIVGQTNKVETKKIEEVKFIVEQ